MAFYSYDLDEESGNYAFNNGINDIVFFFASREFIESEASIVVESDGVGRDSSRDLIFANSTANTEVTTYSVPGVSFTAYFTYNGYTASITVTGDADPPFILICFTRGAKVATPEGERLIEDLRAGDLVLTRDNGPQPIRWVGSLTLNAETLAQFPDRRPVKIAAGALGDHAETLVSPHHRMLITGWQAQALFGEAEVLASAKSLVNDTTIRQVNVDEVEYFHMLFDAHEIVQVDGAWSESFHPAALTTSMEAATRDEVLTLFPELEAGAMPDPAHRTLRPEDVQVLQG